MLCTLYAMVYPESTLRYYKWKLQRSCRGIYSDTLVALGYAQTIS